jgi:Fe-S-cluster containining protein
VVVTRWAKDEIRYRGQGNDVPFVLAHWTEISLDRAREISPFLNLWDLTSDPARHFYTCDAWDSTTKLCTMHEDRPPVCRGFPWYGGEPNSGLWPWPQCAFWEDVPEADWPDIVKMARVELCAP